MVKFLVYGNWNIQQWKGYETSTGNNIRHLMLKIDLKDYEISHKEKIIINNKHSKINEITPVMKLNHGANFWRRY